MDTTYRKNLKATLTASKDYTDKTKEEIYWHIGDYSISIQPDNTTASTKTVPTGATRCKIKRIYGLTEKFNPSVAYDDASTMTKTMPNVVYDFDCSIVYGNSEVVVDSQTNESVIHNLELSGLKVEGENLLGNHNLELFSNNRYIKTSQNVLILPNTTYTFSNSISTGADGSISILDESLNVIQTIGQSNANKRLVTFSTLSNAKYFKIDRWYIDTASFTIESAEVMLNVGSDALPYEPYVSQTLPIDLSTILYNGSPLFEGNSLKAAGTAKDYITPYLAHKEVGSRAYQSGDEEDTSVLTDGTTTLYALATPIEVSIDWSATLRGIQGYSNGTITLQNTYNMDTANTITYNSIIKENCCAKIVQSRGGNVVKTINLTNDDVEYGYSSTNENNVRDYTTNVGTINVGKRAYQSGDESDTDVITDMEYTYYPLTTPTTESLTAIDNIIEVQPNDVLSFYDSNDNLVTVPSDITYRIEVDRV